MAQGGSGAALVGNRAGPIPFVLRWWVDRRRKRLIDAVEDVPRRRVATAVSLYRLGKVRKLLMTGDNRFIYHNEPEAMRRYALAQGMPDEDIVRRPRRLTMPGGARTTVATGRGTFSG